MNAAEYMQAIKDRHALPSWSAVARHLGVTYESVRLWRTGRTFDDDTALMIAEHLNIEPAQVLADMAAERAHSPRVKEVWQHLADGFGRAAMIGGAAVVGLVALSGASEFGTTLMAASGGGVPVWVLC